MVEIYSRRTYRLLVAGFLLSSVALFGALTPIWVWFLMAPITFLVFLLIMVSFPLLGIVSIFLQTKKHPTFGYLILLPLSVGLYFWITWLFRLLDWKVKGSSDLFLSTLYLVIGLLYFFPCLFVASTLFKYTTEKRFFVAIGGIILLILFAASQNSYRTSILIQEDNWPSWSKCGFEVQYTPKLKRAGWGSCYSYFYVATGGSFNKFELDVFTNNYESVDEWAKNGWPLQKWTEFSPYIESTDKNAHSTYFNNGEDKSLWLDLFEEETTELFNKAEKITVAGHDAIKLPTVPFRNKGAQSFIIFVSNDEGKILKVKCTYESAEMLNTCNMMISTITF